MSASRGRLIRAGDRVRRTRGDTSQIGEVLRSCGCLLGDLVCVLWEHGTASTIWRSEIVREDGDRCYRSNERG